MLYKKKELTEKAEIPLKSLVLILRVFSNEDSQKLQQQTRVGGLSRAGKRSRRCFDFSMKKKKK
jgi:hypothetical protein